MKNCVILLPVAILAWTTSCATTTIHSSSVPLKKISDDCLILIRTVTLNKNNAPTARQYNIRLSSDYGLIAIPNEKKSFVAIMIRKPGVKIVALTNAVNESHFTGETLDEPLDIGLPYTHGKVVVADFAFVQTLEQSYQHHWMTRFEFQKTSNEDRVAVIAQFLTRQASKSWLDEKAR